MFYELNDIQLEQIKQVQNITEMDYGLRANYIPAENLIEIIQDMLCEYHKVEEKIEEYKEN